TAQTASAAESRPTVRTAAAAERHQLQREIVRMPTTRRPRDQAAAATQSQRRTWPAALESEPPSLKSALPYNARRTGQTIRRDSTSGVAAYASTCRQS